VPPFYEIGRPSLAAHLLQACAADRGHRASVLYANMLLAAELGVDAYTRIGFPKEYPPHALAGERFFAREAHGLPALGRDSDHMLEMAHAFGPAWAPYLRLSRLGRPATLGESLAQLKELVERAPGWLDRLADFIVSHGFPVVGCSSTFNETNASFALFRRLKARNSHIVTLLGGANCVGELVEGIASLDPGRRVVDYLFSGDSEETFPQFLDDVRSGSEPEARVIRGGLCSGLDGLPSPDFREYFQQRDVALPQTAQEGHLAEVLYETSRGCWWGERQLCTFCGTNGEGAAYRQKTAQRVLDDLRRVADRYPGTSVYMTDSVMPQDYFETLVPALRQDRLPLTVGYGQRADLSLGQVMALVRAGVSLVQPGIEALSTGLLRRMQKGTVARQNVALLRYARATGLRLLWALLWGLPDDQKEEYEETLALLPLLRHLPPPGSLLHISIDRFSPYFQEPRRFGLKNVQPLGGYRDVFPAGADVARLAHHFVAEYDCASHDHLELIEAIAVEVCDWQAAWEQGGAQPVAHVVQTGEGEYLLFDTRGLEGAQAVQVLDKVQARAALVARDDSIGPGIDWALGQRIGVLLDGWYVPLATGDPELLLAFEHEELDR
jgi:ribosomal peptide maturation radical SAM protein 1